MEERRLSDRILFALELAIDQEDVMIADLLGQALELTLTRFGGPQAVERRHVDAEVLQAFQQLYELRRRRAANTS